MNNAGERQCAVVKSPADFSSLQTRYPFSAFRSDLRKINTHARPRYSDPVFRANAQQADDRREHVRTSRWSDVEMRAQVIFGDESTGLAKDGAERSRV